MKKMVLFLSILVMVVGLSVSAQAALVDMHDGTIYDTDTQLSWLKDAGAGGFQYWADANSWVASLNAGSGFAGLTGWRLPTTSQPDGSCSIQFDPDGPGGFPSQGSDYNCTSEMAHMFYMELGNKGYCDALGNCPQAGWGLTNTGPFTNLQPGPYWSGTEYAPITDNAWFIDFYYGYQGVRNKQDYSYWIWAVRPGARSVSAPATPVPATGSVGLIVLALAGLGLIIYSRKKSTA